MLWSFARPNARERGFRKARLILADSEVLYSDSVVGVMSCSMLGCFCRWGFVCGEEEHHDIVRENTATHLMSTGR